MGSKVTGVKIKGIGKYVPEMVATNEDFTKIVETSDEWITQRTGIKQRHITNGEPTYYLGAMAAKAAMADAGVKAEDIDLIIATTVTGDYFTPSLSCLIQREIGAIGCVAFDLNAACAGFVYGFDTAKRYLQTGDGIKTVLLVASEELSKFVDYTDRSSCVLFGDGAAAFVLETAEDTTYSSFLGADGNGAKYLASRALKSENAFRTNTEEFDMDMPETKDYFFKQDGKEVYKFATKALPNAVEQACAKIEISPDDLDLDSAASGKYKNNRNCRKAPWRFNGQVPGIYRPLRQHIFRIYPYRILRRSCRRQDKKRRQGLSCRLRRWTYLWCGCFRVLMINIQFIFGT